MWVGAAPGGSAGRGVTFLSPRNAKFAIERTPSTSVQLRPVPQRVGQTHLMLCAGNPDLSRTNMDGRKLVLEGPIEARRRALRRRSHGDRRCSSRRWNGVEVARRRHAEARTRWDEVGVSHGCWGLVGVRRCSFAPMERALGGLVGFGAWERRRGLGPRRFSGATTPEAPIWAILVSTLAPPGPASAEARAKPPTSAGRPPPSERNNQPAPRASPHPPCAGPPTSPG